jgi:hypothetical protein
MSINSTNVVRAMVVLCVIEGRRFSPRTEHRTEPEYHPHRGREQIAALRVRRPVPNPVTLSPNSAFLAYGSIDSVKVIR